MLIDTEFKNLNCNFEFLNDYCVCVDNHINSINNYIYKNIINDITCYSVNLLDECIIDNTFIAIIINKNNIDQTYNSVYSVLKYDILNKKIYYDIFISHVYYSHPTIKKQKHKHPLISDKIYEFVYNDFNNICHLNNKIDIIQKHVFHKIELFKIKINKNIKDHLCEFIPIDDNQNKINYKNINSISDIKYNLFVDRLCELIKNTDIFETKKYIIIASSYELLDKNIYYINQGNENHAECQLINNHKIKNPIIIRLYYNYKVGCGVPCQNCVKMFIKNGIKEVVYSINNSQYVILPIKNDIYTYTTTGYKILHYDKYLYENFIVKKRMR
jgi:hypothetical protein